jgi:hypothetical protein
MRRQKLQLAGLALGCLGAALAPAAPAAADWLVTREGGRVETRGTWDVKGRLVVFQGADGALASLRVADVDLDASRRATEAAKQSAAKPAAAPGRSAERKSVRSLTDKDFRRVGAAGETAPGSPETPETPEKAAAKTKEEAPKPGVSVASWDRSADPTDGHVVIAGILRNGPGASAANITLAVHLYDENGALLSSRQAELATAALPPGEQSGFRAEFPGVFTFATVKFKGDSMNLKTSSVALSAER